MSVYLLVIVAAGLTLVSQFTDTIEFGIAAVALALTSLTLVAAQTWTDHQRAQQQEPTPGHAADERNSTPDQLAVDTETSADLDQAETTDGAYTPNDEPAVSDEGPLPLGVVDIDIVRVIPGRTRFHQPGCSILTGIKSEELTREEAEEEGFTPCSICKQNKATIRKIG